MIKKSTIKINDIKVVFERPSIYVMIVLKKGNAIKGDVVKLNTEMRDEN